MASMYKRFKQSNKRTVDMKKSAVLFMVLVFVAAAFSQSSDAQTKEKIAVYVTGSARDDEKKALGTKILIELVNSGRYRAVERSDDFVRELDREQSKQQSGAVDDNQITQIGKQFGVQVICVADLTRAFGSNQISARLIDVESAEIIAIAEVTNPLESIEDLTAASRKVVRGILGPNKNKKPLFGQSKPKEPKSAGEGNSANVSKVSYGGADFTDMQRFETWGMNTVPGLGSFVLMRDNVGGLIQLGIGAAGYALFFSGISKEEITTVNGTVSQYKIGTTFWFGCGVLVAGGVFNVYRTITYRGSVPRAAANNGDGLYFAVLPDRRDNIGAVALYRKSF